MTKMMTYFSALFLTGFLSLPVAFATPSQEIVHETTGAQGGPLGLWGFDIYKHQSVATRFTPSKTYLLNEIKIWLMNNDFFGEVKGTITVTLRTNKKIGKGKSIPSDTVLETWTLETTAQGWEPVEEIFVSEKYPTLEAGQHYWITATSEDDENFDAVWNISSHTFGFSSHTQRGKWLPANEKQKTVSPTLIVTGTLLP